EKSDPEQKVYMGKGVVVKHHTNYATDARSSAAFKAVLADAGIPYQDYYNRSDLRCGGTLGLIASRQLAMDAVDIGLAQLAMHSAVETVGYEDIDRMKAAVRAVLETRFEAKGEDLVISR
ncbi:MAG: M18 family aminopeptidase, partial [Clostridia bacterium]|nr:M18 family aminopeptidase [Clostridia bacterium]